MNKITRRKLLLATLVFTSPLALADAPNWKIIPADSSLNFRATQNNASVSGQFKSFNGEIKCNLAQPDNCNIKIVVDINSVFSSYSELSNTLKSAEWLDVKDYPKATFQSSQVSKTGDKRFEAKGNLTIRDKTVPITLSFKQTEGNDAKGLFKGTTTLKRTAFGVGTGEWSDTNAIKDEVQIDFTLSAEKK